MTTITLDTIRSSLEGFVPSVIATSDVDGVPNVSLLSQVHYVDRERVALTYQFFNKTRRNIIANRAACVKVLDPVTMAQYRLDLEYEETRTSGPLFESMKAKLAGIASHTGMQGVFQLLGADIYRVRSIEEVPTERLPHVPAARNLLAATRRTCADVARCRDLGELFERALACLQQHLRIEHAMVLVLDPAERQLYTVASRGYEVSGIGSEVPLGAGVIGAAARECVAVRIGHMSTDYGYGAAVRESARLSGLSGADATEIPYPGLEEPQSQLAVPITGCDGAIGVLFAESPDPMRFSYDDEDALSIVAAQVGAAMALLQRDEAPAEVSAELVGEPESLKTVTVRHYAADDSVFLDNDYLIKGVAGAIFWTLARQVVEDGRTEFSNRELRLDPALRLPGYAENLEARLVLLNRRLDERSTDIRIAKSGRGRFRLEVSCRLELEDVAAERPRAIPA